MREAAAKHTLGMSFGGVGYHMGESWGHQQRCGAVCSTPYTACKHASKHACKAAWHPSRKFLTPACLCNFTGYNLGVLDAFERAGLVDDTTKMSGVGQITQCFLCSGSNVAYGERRAPQLLDLDTSCCEAGFQVLGALLATLGVQSTQIVCMAGESAAWQVRTHHTTHTHNRTHKTTRAALFLLNKMRKMCQKDACFGRLSDVYQKVVSVFVTVVSGQVSTITAHHCAAHARAACTRKW